MPTFKVYGAHAETGEDITATIEAATIEEAEVIASHRKVMVARIVEVEQTEVIAAPPTMPGTPRPNRAMPRGHSEDAPTVNVNLPKRSSSLGIVSVILAAIAFLFCWIPFLGLLTIPVAGIAALLAVIGLIVAFGRGGTGIGWPIGGGVLAGVALLIGLTQFAVIAETGRAISTSIQTSAAESERLENDWEPPEGFGKEDIRFAVSRATIGHVPLIDFRGDQTESENELLTVLVSVANLHERKRLEIRDLNSNFSFGESTASLSDDAGNRYRRITFGSTTRLRDGRSRATVDPQSRSGLMLVFERPIPQSRTLTLTIPAEAFGGRGNIRLDFPRP